MPTANSFFDTLIREILNDFDISGGNTTRQTTTPRRHIEELIISAMSEELLNLPPLQNRNGDGIPSTRPTEPSMTTIDENIIEETDINNTPYIPRSELYYFGDRYQQNMGDYISSINNSMTLARHIHNQRYSSSRESHRFHEFDNMLYDYNRNIQNYNENVHTFLGALGNLPLQIPLSTPSRASIPSIPVPSIPPIHSTPSPQTIPSLLSNLLNRADTTMYMVLPRLIPRNGTSALTLSTEQFARSTEQIIYSTTDISGNERERCPISFDEFQQGEHLIKILHCGHVFKTVPLNNWFLRSSTCPVCRYDLNTSTSTGTIHPIGTSIDI